MAWHLTTSSEQSDEPPSLPEPHLHHRVSIELQRTDAEVLREEFVSLERISVEERRGMLAITSEEESYHTVITQLSLSHHSWDKVTSRKELSN